MGVEAKALLSRASVLLISDDWMAGMSCLHTNLIFLPCLKRAVDERVDLSGLQRRVVRDGAFRPFCAFGHHLHLQRTVFKQV